MNKWFKATGVALAALALSVPQLSADPAADKILAKARIASTLQTQNLMGHIRKDGKKVPIALYLRKQDIQFQYYDGKVWNKFHMRFKDGGGQLFELKDGKTLKFDKNKLSQSIMNTDLSYQDLAMSFLYWKKATTLNQENIKGQKCDVVRLDNPGGEGDYDVVHAWVHQKYGALMKVVGYKTRDGKYYRAKEFAVDKLMKVGKEYTLRTMKVDRYDPNSRKLLGSTYLEFDKPKAVRKPL